MNRAFDLTVSRHFHAQPADGFPIALPVVGIGLRVGLNERVHDRGDMPLVDCSGILQAGYDGPDRHSRGVIHAQFLSLASGNSSVAKPGRGRKTLPARVLRVARRAWEPGRSGGGESDNRRPRFHSIRLPVAPKAHSYHGGRGAGRVLSCRLTRLQNLSGGTLQYTGATRRLVDTQTHDGRMYG